MSVEPYRDEQEQFNADLKAHCDANIDKTILDAVASGADIDLMTKRAKLARAFLDLGIEAAGGTGDDEEGP